MSNRNFVRAISIAMLVIACGVLAYSQKPAQPTTVPTATRPGIANAGLVIEKVPEGTTHEAKTGTDGKFNFGVLPAGKYKLPLRVVEDTNPTPQKAAFNNAKSGVKNYDIQRAGFNHTTSGVKNYKLMQVAIEGGTGGNVTKDWDVESGKVTEVVFDADGKREIKGVLLGVTAKAATPSNK